MRATDTVMAFPTLIILITIVSFIGPGIFNSMLAIGLIGWTGVARLVRSLILSIRETDYIMAAQAVGVEERSGSSCGTSCPMWSRPSQSQPASASPAPSSPRQASVFSASASRCPTPSWGNMLNEAQNIQIIESMPWYLASRPAS